MRVWRSPSKLLLIVLLAVLVFTSATALARHTTHPYLGMVEDHQLDDPTLLPENYISVRWALTPTASANLWFPADPSASPTITPVAPLMKTAVARWEEKVPDLEWTEAASVLTANVLVSYGDCVKDSLGSFTVTFPHTDRDRGANFWRAANICLDEDANWRNDNYKISTLMHELGHAYGLNDRYTHVGTCNPDELTIMDGGSASSGPCDPTPEPYPLDVKRVEELFKNGTLSDFAATKEGDTGVFTWKDNAWGERYHEVVYMYKLDWTAHPGEWEVFATSTYSADTGSHKDIAPDPVTGERTVYVFKGTVSLRTHWDRNPTVVLPDKSAYMACGRPFFQQFNTYGPQSCAEIIVDNSAHNAQIPTPRPTATLITLYDADLNGEISRDEVIQAIGDYLFDGLLIRDEVIVLINLYLFG